VSAALPAVAVVELNKDRRSRGSAARVLRGSVCTPTCECVQRSRSARFRADRRPPWPLRLDWPELLGTVLQAWQRLGCRAQSPRWHAQISISRARAGWRPRQAALARRAARVYLRSRSPAASSRSRSPPLAPRRAERPDRATSGTRRCASPRTTGSPRADPMSSGRCGGPFGAAVWACRDLISWRAGASSAAKAVPAPRSGP
jgi:hypothetical protein